MTENTSPHSQHLRRSPVPPTVGTGTTEHTSAVTRSSYRRNGDDRTHLGGHPFLLPSERGRPNTPRRSPVPPTVGTGTTGFEPAVSALTGPRVGPGYTTSPTALTTKYTVKKELILFCQQKTPLTAGMKWAREDSNP